jgi:predicted permease
MHEILTTFRTFRKSPGFVITVVLTIALGIGANTAIFTLVHAVLLRSLPVRDPKMLYTVGSDTSRAGVMNGLPDSGKLSTFSYDLYKHLRATTPGFEQLAAMQSGAEGMNVREGQQLAKSEGTEYVSGNYFSTLGIGAFAGRLFSQQDDTPAAAPAAVMSYATWQADYASDPSVVGKAFTFQGHPITVVGIAPPGFYGDRVSTSPPAFWLPLAVEPMIEGSFSILHSPTSSWLYLLGRIKPDVSIRPLAEQMTGNVRNWLSTQPEYTRNGGASVIAKQQIRLVPGGSGIQQLQHQESTGLYLLMAISGLVLLVACANVANLLLAKGSASRADTSVRIALGAQRNRIVRQMLTESVMLSCLGGAVGLALAYVGTRMILSVAFPDSPQLPIHASPSSAVLGFAFLLSLVTGAIFGVAPAWMTSHADPAEALRGANRSTRDRVSLPQRSLIVFQAALSLVLLVGAGLLTRSLVRLQKQDFGFLTANRYVVQVDPAGAGYTVETLPAFYRAVQDRFGALPNVANVGLALYSPLSGTRWATGITIAGRPAPAAGAQKTSDMDRVSPRFFAALGERLLRGRVFNDSDTATSQGVAVVNQEFAKEFFPGEDPVGQSFGAEPGRSDTHRIIGVVADAKFADPAAGPHPMYFLPPMQRVPGLKPAQAASESKGLFVSAIVLDFKTPPQNVDALVRRTLGDINPNLTVGVLHTLEYQVNGNFTENRLISRLAMLFGLLALMLAAIGLYGVTSYRVARRTSEIGLRMALGATRGGILLMVLRGAFVQVGLGLAIGVPVAMLGAHSIASQLYGVAPYDPVSMLLAIAALAIAAGAAALLPARRAASTEPMIALRTE